MIITARLHGSELQLVDGSQGTFELLGCQTAQLGERLAHIQRLKFLDATGPGSSSSLWPFTACCLPLSDLFHVMLLSNIGLQCQKEKHSISFGMQMFGYLTHAWLVSEF